MQEGSGQIWIRRGAAILAALLVAVLAYVLIAGGDDDDGGSEGEVTEEVIAADAARLSQLAGEQDHPIYWAGREDAQTFEWSELSDGRVYIRYLTGGAEINDPSPRFLTVGTYPVGDGIEQLEISAKKAGARTFEIEDEGTVLVNENNPTSVYLAYPDSEYQIEVFDPDPARALKLVTSGKIQPVP